MTKTTKMQVLLCFAVLIAAAAADKGYAYHGRYSGKCGTDGFYDSDDYSFVICSNGNSYKQPCPPGSKNSGAYTRGKYYSAHPFCDVNLVDHGYTVRHGHHHNKGYNNHHSGYNNHGHNDYGYGKSGYGHNHGHSYGNRGYDSYGHGGYNRGYGNNYNSGYGYNSYGHRDRGYGYNNNHYGVAY